MTIPPSSPEEAPAEQPHAQPAAETPRAGARWISRFFPASPARVFASLLRLVVFLLFTLISWWFLAGLLVPLASALVASSVSLGLAVLMTTAVMMRIYEMRPFYVVGLFGNRTGARHSGIGLALGAGSSLLVVLVQWGAGWARFERGAAPANWTPTFLFGFLILAVGATGEELLFRGYGFQHLIRAFGPWFSIASTSIVFAWAHSANPDFSRVGMINTALFGIIFGYAYWRTRDLWLPLGMHFAWNSCLATIGANVSGLKIKLTAISVVSVGSPLWSGGDYGPEASLLTTVVLVAVGGFLWKAPQRRQQEGLLVNHKEAAHEGFRYHTGGP